MTTQKKRQLLYWPWMALPLVLVCYLIFWNSLPERMGVHTGWNGKFDGWMSREASLLVSLAGLTAMLLASTWKVRRHSHVSKILLVRHCLGTVVVTAVVLLMLLRNVQ